MFKVIILYIPFFIILFFASVHAGEKRDFLLEDTLCFFQGASAFKDVQAQCNLGPRPPMTVAHLNCRKYIIAELEKLDLDVKIVSFKGTYGSGKGVDFFNIIASKKNSAPVGPFLNSQKKIIFCAHYDTRPFAEKDKDYPEYPIPGANDGASGTAVVLETARFFNKYDVKKFLNKCSKNKTNVSVEYIFFDGEDYGLGAKNMFYGSRHHAANIADTDNIELLILFDMVGDRNLNIYYEVNSYNSAPEFLTDVFKSANFLGYSDNFIPSKKYRISDDHLPFIKKGIKAVDIIDFDYPYWHTLEDDITKVDAVSLEKTGRSVLYSILKKYTLK